MALSDLKTMVVPVKKKGSKYIIEVTKGMWNSVQIVLLKGAQQDGVVIEFDIEEEAEDGTS